MTLFKKVEIPRTDAFDPEKLGQYHELLRQRVFPALDALDAEGLVEGYDFLSHQGIDLRLWLPDGVDLDRVIGVLIAHDLPNVLTEYPPAESGGDRDRLLGILRRNVEQVRALIEDQTCTRRFDEIVHWFLNSYGFHNVTEYRWHKAVTDAHENGAAAEGHQPSESSEPAA